jgi:hypothetical protein
MRCVEFHTVQVRGGDHVVLGANETVMSVYWDPSIDVYTATVMVEHDVQSSDEPQEHT